MTTPEAEAIARLEARADRIEEMARGYSSRSVADALRHASDLRLALSTLTAYRDLLVEAGDALSPFARMIDDGELRRTDITGHNLIDSSEDPPDILLSEFRQARTISEKIAKAVGS
jgi:pilus assembly protein TadC